MVTFLLLGVLFLAALTLFFIFFFTLRVDIRVLLSHFFFFRFFFFFCLFFFFLGFHSRTFTIHRTAAEGGRFFFNSSLPLPPASQTLRRWPGDYCRELTSAYSQQPDSNREFLVSERKLLTTKLRTFAALFVLISILFF